MKIDGFATNYISDDQKMRIYFYPGYSDDGHILCKFSFITKDIDYLYTKQSDGAIEYIINAAPPKIQYKLVDTLTGESKNFEIIR